MCRRQNKSCGDSGFVFLVFFSYKKTVDRKTLHSITHCLATFEISKCGAGEWNSQPWFCCGFHLVMNRNSRSFRNQNTRQKSAQPSSDEERESGNTDCDLSATLCCSEMLIARFRTMKHFQEASKQTLSDKVQTIFLKGGGEN